MSSAATRFVRTRRCLVAAALFASLAAAPGAAQIRRPTVGANLSVQSFSFDQAKTLGIEGLRLTSLHFAASAPIVEHLVLAVDGAWASGTMKQAGSGNLDISGLTDTQVSLTFSPHPFFTVSGLFLAPTGKETQSLDQSIVAGAIASDLFPFKVSNWGSGGGGGVNASLARPLGPVGVGLSVGLIAGRKFQPLDGAQFAYRPGTLLRIVGAIDGTVGQASKASLKLTYHRYGQDQINGNNLFQSGNRFQAMGSLAFPMGPASSGLVYAGITHRQRSTVLGQALPYAQALPSQNLILLGGGFRRPVGTSVLQPDAELRILRRSDSAGQGFDLGVGATLELRTAHAVFAPSARLHVGRLEVIPGSTGSVFGFEIGLTARMRGES